MCCSTMTRFPITLDVFTKQHYAVKFCLHLHYMKKKTLTCWKKLLPKVFWMNRQSDIGTEHSRKDKSQPNSCLEAEKENSCHWDQHQYCGCDDQRRLPLNDPSNFGTAAYSKNVGFGINVILLNSAIPFFSRMCKTVVLQMGVPQAAINIRWLACTHSMRNKLENTCVFVTSW